MNIKYRTNLNVLQQVINTYYNNKTGHNWYQIH